MTRRRDIGRSILVRQHRRHTLSLPLDRRREEVGEIFEGIGLVNDGLLGNLGLPLIAWHRRTGCCWSIRGPTGAVLSALPPLTVPSKQILVSCSFPLNDEIR